MATSRTSQIATIKIAAKQLGMDDDTYRAMLRGVTGGKSSAADLTWPERKAVIDHLKSKGAKITASPKRKGEPANLNREPQLQKIEALLADMGLSWAYAESIAENITGGKAGGIKRLAWVREIKHLQGVIAALTYEQKKRNLLADVDHYLKRVGKTRADIAARISPNYKKDWTRDAKALCWICNSMPEWWPV